MLFKCCAARLAGNFERLRTLSRSITTIPRRDEEKNVRYLSKDVDGCLNANNLRLTLQALKKIRSKSTFHTTGIQTADDQITLNKDGR